MLLQVKRLGTFQLLLLMGILTALWFGGNTSFTITIMSALFSKLLLHIKVKLTFVVGKQLCYR